MRRYPGVNEALTTYETLRDILFSQDLDATVFRFTLDGVSHVAIVAEEPLSGDPLGVVTGELARSSGEAAELPSEVVGQLLARRQTFKSLGLDYLEVRDQQGRRGMT